MTHSHRFVGDVIARVISLGLKGIQTREGVLNVNGAIDRGVLPRIDCLNLACQRYGKRTGAAGRSLA